jgi:hypothetical protein
MASIVRLLVSNDDFLAVDFEFVRISGPCFLAPKERFEAGGVLRRLWRPDGPHIRKEILMRIPALAILTIGAALTATPAAAQTYDPRYPVCLQIYQGFVDYYFECAYTSLPQCQMSASGRAAQCVVNPYYTGTRKPPRQRDRRPRREY